KHKAAYSVAPPEYSQHHTGFALDIGDGSAINKNYTSLFVKSKAFEFLDTNANKFGFELSFPKNNTQGIKYEPWHWRYIKSEEAKIIFHKPRIKNQ
ncbi:MAG: D-alanyl-D-alanine carboxypeptidase family protein, partial [Candidatus Margulisiibacteriota bacterium]